MSNEHLNSGRKAQKLQTRKKILKAANNLVKNNQALNMDAVAQEAGISRATIYRYYSNTEDIATELILQLNVPDAEKLNSGLKGTNLTDAMKSIQNAYLDFILKSKKHMVFETSKQHEKPAVS